jgi:hypothetical protein
MATYKLVNWVAEIYDPKIEVVVKTVVCAFPIFHLSNLLRCKSKLEHSTLISMGESLIEDKLRNQMFLNSMESLNCVIGNFHTFNINLFFFYLHASTFLDHICYHVRLCLAN